MKPTAEVLDCDEDGYIIVSCSYDVESEFYVKVVYWYDKHLEIHDILDIDDLSISNLPIQLSNYLIAKVESDFKIIDTVRDWIKELGDDHVVKQTYMESWISVMNRMDDDTRPID